MEEVKVVHIPTHDPQYSLDPNSSQSLLTGDVSYRKVVGKLLFLNLSYVQKLQIIHWNAVKRIFKYLKGTLHYLI